MSVMNMKATEPYIPGERKARLRSHPEILQELPPSNMMQKNGQILDPEYLAFDTERKLVYRKEKYFGDNRLPAEYLIRDRRYCQEEIVDLVLKAGFMIYKILFARAGHFDTGLAEDDPKAKEIVLVCRKCLK